MKFTSVIRPILARSKLELDRHHPILCRIDRLRRSDETTTIASLEHVARVDAFVGSSECNQRNAPGPPHLERYVPRSVSAGHLADAVLFVTRTVLIQCHWEQGKRYACAALDIPYGG